MPRQRQGDQLGQGAVLVLAVADLADHPAGLVEQPDGGGMLHRVVAALDRHALATNALEIVETIAADDFAPREPMNILLEPRILWRESA